MILISHRGNIDGINKSEENKPNYIDLAITNGFDVEVDIWFKNEKLYLGHDSPDYEILLEWLEKRVDKLWIHCKNFESVVFFSNHKEKKFNYFWHQTDDLTLTSKQYIWVYPGKQPIKNSISVLPEINDDDISSCLGICSDYIKNFL